MDFEIKLVGGVRTIVFEWGSQRPATMPESALWSEVEQLKLENRKLKQIAELAKAFCEPCSGAESVDELFDELKRSADRYWGST